jgi:hypothetical protein
MTSSRQRKRYRRIRLVWKREEKHDIGREGKGKERKLVNGMK